MAARCAKCSVKWRDREKYEEAEKLPLELDPRIFFHFIRECMCGGVGGWEGGVRVCVCV